MEVDLFLTSLSHKVFMATLSISTHVTAPVRMTKDRFAESRLSPQPDMEARDPTQVVSLRHRLPFLKGPAHFPRNPRFPLFTAFLVGMSHFVQCRLGNCKGREVTPVPESVLGLGCVFFHLCGRTDAATMCGTL